MAQTNQEAKWGTLAVILWLLFPLLFIDITIGTFVAPAMVPHWKAEGLKEAPMPWQQVIDIADYCKMHAVVVFPTLFIGALATTLLTIARRVWTWIKR